jgi:hypothetical protein
MSKLVGFKKFTGKKDGTKYCVLQVVGEFNAREKNNGCAGQKVEEVFMPADKVDSVNESLIGREVKLDYELSGNRAYLVDVTFSDKVR